MRSAAFLANTLFQVPMDRQGLPSKGYSRCVIFMRGLRARVLVFPRNAARPLTSGLLFLLGVARSAVSIMSTLHMRRPFKRPHATRCPGLLAPPFFLFHTPHSYQASPDFPTCSVKCPPDPPPSSSRSVISLAVFTVYSRLLARRSTRPSLHRLMGTMRLQ